MQKVYSTYTHQDWLNGKIFYNNRKLCLDLFHGFRGAELDKHKLEIQYQELSEEIDPQEKRKIRSDQTKFYKERVDSHFNSAKENFFALCARENNKLQKVNEEIERFEKILYTEKLPVINPDQKYDFGRFALDGSKILSLRSILTAVSINKTYELSGINAPPCRFHFPSNTYNYIEADYFYRYLNWLRSLKDELEKRNQINSNQDIMELLNFFESYIGFNHKSLFIVSELEKIMAVEMDIEALERGASSFSQNNQQLAFWAWGFFQKEAEKTITQIKADTIQRDNTEKIKTYISQVYSFTKGLLEKSKAYNVNNTFGVEEHAIRISLDAVLNTFKSRLELDYDLYLDDSDKKKITIQNYFHCVLHEFEDYNKQIYIQTHKQDCTCIKDTLLRLEKYIRDKFTEFENQYKTIARNWINYNCEMGNSFTEKQFVQFAFDYFKKLFKFDKDKNVYYVPDHRNERFEFHPDFYTLQIVPFNNLFSAFFEMCKLEITALPTVHEDNHTSELKKSKIQHSFVFALKGNQAFGKLNDLHDKLKQHTFISDTTQVKPFKKIFSGNKIAIPVTWIGTATELRYFILLIHNEYKIIKHIFPSQWPIACKCFQDAKGAKFLPNKLKDLKLPNDKRKKLLDDILEDITPHPSTSS